MERHPDLLELRNHYEVAGQSPTAQFSDGLTLLAGIYLALSPWIAGFSGLGPITINNLVIGIVVAGLALGFSSAFGRTHGIAWVSPILGVWTIVAPWVISGDMSTTRTIWNNVVTGLVIVCLGIVMMSFGMGRGFGRRGR
jgi:hypothetical protein